MRVEIPIGPVRAVDPNAKVTCVGPEELFGSVDGITIELNKALDINGPLGCEGGGMPGWWCEFKGKRKCLWCWKPEEVEAKGGIKFSDLLKKFGVSEED